MRLRTGVALQGKVGSVNASWPLGVFTITDDGVAVDIAPKILKRLVQPFMGPGSGRSPAWSASWDRMAPVDVGRRALILRSIDDPRGCRVVFSRRRYLKAVSDDFATRRVEMRQVKTTLGWYFR